VNNKMHLTSGFMGCQWTSVECKGAVCFITVSIYQRVFFTGEIEPLFKGYVGTRHVFCFGFGSLFFFNHSVGVRTTKARNFSFDYLRSLRRGVVCFFFYSFDCPQTMSVLNKQFAREVHRI
jgi:hypothetical protein